jgi:hypothetical protein
VLRKAFTIASAVSLVLFVGTVVLWGRSYSQSPSTAGNLAFGSLSRGSRTFRYVLFLSYAGRLEGEVDRETGSDEESVDLIGLHCFQSDLTFDMGPQEPPSVLSASAFHGSYERSEWPAVAKTYLKLTFIVPYWPLAAMFGLAPTIWICRYVVRRSHRRSGRCPSCGYDLRATPDRCPECGAAVVRSGPAIPPRG